MKTLMFTLALALQLLHATPEDALKKAMDQRADTDCKYLESQNAKFRSKNPSFFENQRLYKSCYINLSAMLNQCVLDNAKNIGDRVKPSDSLEEKAKVLGQEKGVLAACVIRALTITRDDVNEAAPEKTKSDAYFEKAMRRLNSKAK